MSTWTHNICKPCWRLWSISVHGIEKDPVSMVNAKAELCCFCGAINLNGIFVRENPKSNKLVCSHDRKEVS